MRSSLRLVFAIGALVPGAIVAGCTFLVSFEDMPGLEDAGGSRPDVVTRDRQVPTTPEEPITPVDAGSDAAVVFPPPCDPSFPLDAVACGGANGSVCARTLASYPSGHDPGSDLVRCGPGGATCVQHCPFGCAEMPNGFSDQCDPCNGRRDGYYCGHELAGSPTENADLAIRCESGTRAEAAVCGRNRCAAPCSRDGGPTPSCCI